MEDNIDSTLRTIALRRKLRAIEVKRKRKSNLIKSVYLLSGLAGLVGFVFISVKIFTLVSVSCFNMVLLFGAACLSLAVTSMGFFGFYEFYQEGRK